MKAFQTILALVITMSIGIQCYAQRVLGHIDSVRMIPPDPTMNDTINLIVYNSFPSAGCSNKQQYYTENLPYINNTSKYCIGMYTIICYDRDTIKIHPLFQGSYFLHYKIETANDYTGCDPYYPADSIDFQINVNYPASIGKMIGRKSIFKIIYDLTFDKFILYLNQYSENYTVIIQNIFGKEIYRKRLYYLNNELSCNWEVGIYLVTVFNDDVKQTQKVIIKNNH